MTIFKDSKDDVSSNNYDIQAGSIFYGNANAGTLRLPSYTTTLRDAIASPVAGDTIYNSTTNKLNFYNGSSWEAVTSS